MSSGAVTSPDFDIAGKFSAQACPTAAAVTAGGRAATQRWPAPPPMARSCVAASRCCYAPKARTGARAQAAPRRTTGTASPRRAAPAGAWARRRQRASRRPPPRRPAPARARSQASRGSLPGPAPRRALACSATATPRAARGRPPAACRACGRRRRRGCTCARGGASALAGGAERSARHCAAAVPSEQRAARCSQLHGQQQVCAQP